MMIELSDSFRTFFAVDDDHNARQWFKSLQGENLQIFLDLLKSPDIDTQMVETLAKCYGTFFNDNPDADARGIIGFLLFTLMVERPDFESNLSKEYLSKEEVKDFIFKEYEIKAIVPRDILRFHRAGTTSFILKVDSSQQQATYALKLLKMRYFSNRNITQKTKGYKEIYAGSLKHAPRIVDSNARHIVMEFIDGLTLREYVTQYIRPKIIKTEYTEQNIDHLVKIISMICDALNYYNTCEPTVCHLDLSPDNILLETNLETGVVSRISLIDFGYNYILAEGIGSLHAHANARVYIAKELGESYGNIGDYKSDLYSLGMILLNMASEVELRPENVYSNLEELWMHFADIAPIIEQLVSDDPDCREILPLEADVSIYMRIKAALIARIKLLKTMEERSKQSSVLTIGANLISDLVNIAIGGLINMVKRFTKVKQASSGSDANIPLLDESREEAILTWAKITYGCNFCIAVLFLYCGWPHFTSIYLAARSTNFFSWASIFGFLHAIPIELAGQLVGVSFALVATSYYMNIFSSLYPPVGLAAPFYSNLAHFTIRLNSFFFCIPIGIAMVKPSLWPVCSAVGVFIVAFNNVACRKLVLYAQDEKRLQLNKEQSKYLKDFGEDFKEWGPLMYLYGFALLATMAVLYFNIARDEWAYAAIVIFFVNHQKLYQYNTLENAPKVRAALARTSFWIESRLTK